MTIVLDTLVDAGLLHARGRQRSDSTHVLGQLRTLSRLALVGETMRHALNDLAEVAPDGLLAHLDPAWAERSAVRVEEDRLPKATADRTLLEVAIGEDGYALLDAVFAADAPADRWQRPAVQILRGIWLQQDDGLHDVRWRSRDDRPPHALLLTSPYETEARFATKRETSWTGSKVHLSETCDDDQPHLMTNVETTPSTTNDVGVTETIHAHVAARDLLPTEHLVDTGYVASEVLVASQQQEIDLVGPALSDKSWQARQPDGLDLRCFAINWEAQQVICPAGKVSVRWTPGVDTQGVRQDIIAVPFDPDDCRDCPVRPRCTQAKTGPRTMRLRPQEQHEALQRAKASGHRGVQGVVCGPVGHRRHLVARGSRAFGLRSARYRGQAKTHLQHILIAINLVRVFAWIQEIPRAVTRQSAFARSRRVRGLSGPLVVNKPTVSS